MSSEKKQILPFIPNLLTVLGLFSGLLAIIFAVDGQLGWAGLFVLIAAIFDLFDGLVARLLNATSEFGKQLDSLADVVSFGVAPGMILFTLLEFSLFKQNQPIYEIEGKWFQWLILSSALLIPVFSALRLAKFNIDKNQSDNFIGLPTPAAAIFFASLGLMIEFQQHTEFLKLLFTTKNLVISSFIVSFLMISNIPMYSLKFKSFKWSNNWYKIIFLTASLILLIIWNVYALPLVIFLYVLLNIVLYLLKIQFKQ